MKFLTNLIFEPKGKHDPTLAYSIKDTVMSEDGSRVYFALQDVPVGIDLADEDYWKLQIDLSDTKSSMDNAIADFANYARETGLRVKGETAKAAGNPVSFFPDAGSLLQPVTVLTPRQEGSGDPSPDNIRPFIGYDKLELNAAGKNLLKNDASTQITNGVTVTVDADGSVICDGTSTATSTPVLSNNIIPAGSYILSGCPAGGSYSGDGSYRLQADITMPDGTIKNISDTGSGVAFTLNETPASVAIFIILAKNGVYNRLTFRPMLRLASETDATYEPYVGNLYTVQLGQTVYGGRFDWLAGKLTAEWGVYALTGADGARLTSASTYNGKCFLSDVIPNMVGNSAALSGATSSHFTEGIWNNVVNMDAPFGKFSITTSNKIGIAFDGTIDEANAWLAAQNAAGTPVQVAYKLATPFEIQLTPQLISTADPEQTNTLYGDGEIEVTYVKPLHVSIEEHVAAAVAAAMTTTAE